MKVARTALPGVLVIEPEVYSDARGFFLESYHALRYRQQGLPPEFVQDNHSQSRHGTLRGLHAQVRQAQAKLVRVIEGEVFDVAVDIRLGSPTFGRWTGVCLSAVNRRQFFIPEGFAHGFATTSPSAQVEYKCSRYYDPDDQVAIRWDDPEIGIEWPVRRPFLSAKDRDAPLLSQLRHRLPRFD